MEYKRRNPDALLEEIQAQEQKNKTGHLKIFFGYAAGVGKTYAMLEAAHIAQSQGVNVLVGYIEPHARPQTMALLDGLKLLPTKTILYNEMILQEFDIDQALDIKPDLVLVDELAHTNVEGSRHAKRYQDIKELLQNGIDVYTTVNVQHIESLNDLVASITGIMVRERIPDQIFDEADQIELVDIEPADLLIRLSKGEVYQDAQAKRATENFFKLENLTALREIALRRTADRINRITEQDRIRNQSNYHTDEHILVCLSSSPSNPKIIRSAARMAAAFRGTFTALFIETPDFSDMNEEDKKRLRTHIHLAQQLGATIETVYGSDISLQISEFAKFSGVSKIVIGSKAVSKKYPWSRPSLTDQLITTVNNLDIYIIPETVDYISRYQKKKQKTYIDFSFTSIDIIKSILIILGATGIGFLFEEMHLSETNIITIYILGVLLISIVTTNFLCSFFASITSVLLFNFMFIAPKYSFRAADISYPITFLIMFIAALITGSLAVKLRSSAKQSALSAYRTKVLFDTSQLMQQAKTSKEILTTASSQIQKLLNKAVILYLPDKQGLGQPIIFPLENEPIDESAISSNEQAIAHWVFQNNRRAGVSTDTLSSSKCLYLAIRMHSTVYGVIGIVMPNEPIDSFEESMLLSILSEAGLNMENARNTKEKEEATILAESEQLRANLLRAISHDLRTPLTAISGNASNLLFNSNAFNEDTKKQLYADIYDDSMWLINLVENLLSVTRLEEGHMNLHKSAELVDDVISASLTHVNRNKSKHTIKINHDDDLLLAYMDAQLIVQVIINIVDNAIKYSQEGSIIQIHTFKQDDKAVIEISDNGPGISKETKEHIFDMFFIGDQKIVDSQRSLGLGLSLCKSIIRAHDGDISVTDNWPTGAKFKFTLPLKELENYE